MKVFVFVLVFSIVTPFYFALLLVAFVADSLAGATEAFVEWIEKRLC